MKTKYKVLLIAAAAAIMTLSVYGCSNNGTNANEPQNENEQTEQIEDNGETEPETEEEPEVELEIEGGVGLVNPVVGYESAEAINEAVGFPMNAPEGSENVSYSVINGKVAQTVFTLNGKEYTGRGSKEMSGVELHGVYGEGTEEPIDDMIKTVYSDGKAVITWTGSEVNYSLYGESDGLEDMALALRGHNPEVLGGNGVVNPLAQYETLEEINTEKGVALFVPEGATDVTYWIINGKTAQVKFSVGENQYTMRASKEKSGLELHGVYGDATEMTDGMYKVSDFGTGTVVYEWTVGDVNYSLSGDSEGVKNILLSATPADAEGNAIYG